MKSIILCEGGTDLALIQYFMEVTYQWEYIEQKNEKLYYPHIITRIRMKKKNQQIKWFKKGDNYLAIYAVGGVSQIEKELGRIINANQKRQLTDVPFDKIIIITDQDEVNTVANFNGTLGQVLQDHNIVGATLNNNEWLSFACQRVYDDEEDESQLLLLVIPFEETGALETFLLEALSKKNSTDEKVIQQANEFIDNLDTDNKYLQHRRHITKAKFDVYFSIRTPLEQFQERRNILRSIPWEDYEEIQESFKKLGDLT